MIKKLFICLCSGMVIAPAVLGQIGKVQSPNEYQLITLFSDEFIGTTLNATKWENYDRASGRTNREYVYASPSCNQVGPGSDGANVLKLIAKKEFLTATDWYGVPYDHFYQGGVAVSKTFFYHGYYEIRVKTPNVRNTNGMAFWFWDRDATGVYSEIDGFETQPIFKYRCPTATHHSTNADETYEYSLQNCTKIPTDITDGWHTYGVEWTPDAITFYVDGVIVDKNTTIQSSSNTDNTSITPRALRRMRLVLSNVPNFGIEASTGGDVMEIDYFRYYKRKPTIYFSSYNSSTEEYTYAANTNTPNDAITWSYNASQITVTNTMNINGIAYIQFKRVSPPPIGNITLTAKATQTLQLQDGITQNISASSTINIGNDNSSFYTGDPYFYGSKNAIRAYASSPNPYGSWAIGLKNTNGTIDWSAPQTQQGPVSVFTNLLSGKTYMIKYQRPAEGTHLAMTETLKEVTISFNSEFIIDKIQSPSPSSNTLQMLVHQVDINPDSEWHIWSINPDGSVNTSFDQPQWGQTATFNNLVRGTTYQVTHGNYGPNQAWLASSKFIPVELESNFEFYDPNEHTLCSGTTPKICYEGNAYQLYVYSRDYNPLTPSINGYSSQFYIYELDATGNYSPSTPLAGPIASGKNKKLTVQLNKNYLIKHGVYSPNGIWTETRKTINTSPKYVRCTKSLEVSDEESEEITEENLGIQENEDNELQIFPNPTTGELNIKQFNDTYRTASILDPIGRVVMKNLSLEKGSIDISQLPSGTYILQLESMESGIKTIKIIKR